MQAEIRSIRVIRGQSLPFLAALVDPGSLLGRSVSEWSVILAQARATRLLHRLAVKASDAGVLNDLPEPARTILAAAVDEWHVRNQRSRWELEYTLNALQYISSLSGGSESNVYGQRLATPEAKLATPKAWSKVSHSPLVLLKGTAYRLLDLPCARGRMYNDLDILVRPDSLASAEQALVAAGWEMTELLPHQEDYFRRWMHEIPTLVHKEHGIKVDLHHNILPRIDRIRIDPQTLIDASVEASGLEGVRILSSEDLILHSAVHLFRRGEFSNGLRDLLDIREMMESEEEGSNGVMEYGSDGADGFRERLFARARELHLTRPLSLALHYSELLFGRQEPASCLRRDKSRIPHPASVFGHLYLRALLPPRLDRHDHMRERIHWFLQHWPPSLWRKTIRPKLERLYHEWIRIDTVQHSRN